MTAHRLALHDCPDCTHTVAACPICGMVDGDHYEQVFDMADWCPNSPVVIAVKAAEKRQGIYDPDEWTDGAYLRESTKRLWSVRR